MKKRKQPGSTKDGTTPWAGLDPRAAGQRGGLRPLGWDARKLAGLRVEERHGDSRSGPRAAGEANGSENLNCSEGSE